MSLLAETAIHIYITYWVRSENSAYKEKFISDLSQLVEQRADVVRFNRMKDHIYQREIYHPLCGRLTSTARRLVEHKQCMGVCQFCQTSVERVVEVFTSREAFENRLMIFCQHCCMLTDIYF